ncbi:MAG: hypothetical protein M3501_03690 [Actinomycetota bacterium]|nr:hypothetical protein [Actinomycetota bacterium]
MSITEYQRHQLFTWFEEHMGKDRATTMMNLVPPVGWGDVVTTRDLQLHRAETKQDLLEFRLAVEADMTSMRHEIAATRHEIAAAESRLGRTFASWLFASQAAVIGAMAVLLAID